MSNNNKVRKLQNGNAFLMILIDDLVRKKRSLFNKDGSFSPDIEHENLAYGLSIAGLYESLGDRVFMLNQSRLDSLHSRITDILIKNQIDSL